MALTMFPWMRGRALTVAGALVSCRARSSTIHVLEVSGRNEFVGAAYGWLRRSEPAPGLHQCGNPPSSRCRTSTQMHGVASLEQLTNIGERLEQLRTRLTGLAASDVACAQTSDFGAFHMSRTCCRQQGRIGVVARRAPSRAASVASIQPNFDQAVLGRPGPPGLGCSDSPHQVVHFRPIVVQIRPRIGMFGNMPIVAQAWQSIGKTCASRCVEFGNETRGGRRRPGEGGHLCADGVARRV